MTTPADQTSSEDTIASGALVSGTDSAPLTPVSAEVVLAQAQAKQETLQGHSKAMQDALDTVAKLKNPAVVNALAAVRQYVIDMDPAKQMGGLEGARHQATLFNAIRQLIDFGGEEFAQGWSVLLRLFAEYRRAALQDVMVMRFVEHSILAPLHQKAFESILNLILTTAGTTRQARKALMQQIDLNRTLRYVFSDEGKRRVASYYSV